MNVHIERVLESANRLDMAESLLLGGLGTIAIGGLLAVAIYNSKRPFGQVVDIREELDGEPAIHPKTWN